VSCNHELRATIVAERGSAKPIVCQRSKEHDKHAWVGIINDVLVAVKWEKP
jgi:hypothetical protein